MKVTEREIFNFVFYPDLLRKEIKAFLASIEGTSEEINFYKELKTVLAEKTPPSLRKKIAKKINAYKFENKVILYPLHEPLHNKRPEHLVLAAASEKNGVPKIVTKTFVDDGKDYLVKILTYGNSSKIFVFSTNDEIVKDFDIVIAPQNLKFHLKDNTEPLKIDKAIEAEQVTIEF